MALPSTILPQSVSVSSTMALFNATFPNTSSGRLEVMDLDVYRQELSDQMAVTLLPALIIISVLMVIGCIGNTVVFYIYLTKFNPSSTRSAILALASFDLLASCVAMPGEIIDLRYSFNFMSAILCKCFRLGTMVVLIASGLTLLVVAVDRYRRICRHMANQLTPGQTKKWALGSFVVAIIFATPAPIMYGLSQVKTPTEGLYGVECSIDHSFKGHILPLVYNTILCALFISVFAAMIVLYILLGRQVLRQNTFRNLVVRRTFSQEDGDHSISDRKGGGPASQGAVSPVTDLSQGPYFDDSKDLDAEQRQSKHPRRQSVFRGKASNGDIRTRKTTLMLFIISAVFVTSFLPNLILKGLQAAKKDFPSNESDTGMVLYNIFVRSYFFNSVANCFIYGFCSPKFRRECKKLLFRIICCRKTVILKAFKY